VNEDVLSLSIDELDSTSSRVEGSQHGTFFKAVHGDIQQAVEHTAGHWLRGGIDHKQWKRQYEYHLLVLDR
jgi:hypothetical protein